MPVAARRKPESSGGYDTLPRSGYDYCSFPNPAQRFIQDFSRKIKSSGHHFFKNTPGLCLWYQPAIPGNQHDAKGASDGNAQTGGTLSAGQIINNGLGAGMRQGQCQYT